VSLPGTFLSTRAGRVFVHRSGHGAPLVLVHGWMMSHFYFRDVVDALAAEREVIAVDLPGHGESDRPSTSVFAYTLPAYATLLGEVMEGLGLPAVDVLGASMGGGVALTLAAQSPERVKRLVLSAPAIYPPAYLPLDARVLLSPIGAFVWKNLVTRREYGRSCRYYNVRDPLLLDEHFVDYYWARLQRAGGLDAAYACMRAMADCPAEPSTLERVQAPALLVWGDEDRLVPLAQGKRLARALPDARLEVIPACGHLPFVERPKEFLRAVRPFLAAPAEREPLVQSAAS
jgi:pimeloyl-ACP methyl ester carboxylesterase